MEEAEVPRKPRDAKTVEAILKSMGVESYDPRVVCQLLELLHRYVSSILTDSREFSEHAEKTAIDIDDIRLAIRSKCAFNFTQPPPRDVTMRLAAERNTIPLPPVDLRAGVALPPNDCQLTAQNYRVVVEAKQSYDKTPQSSPKRPRLMVSPAGTNRSAPKAIKTQERTPGSSKVVAQKNTKSPTHMNVDSPVRKASASATPPKNSNVTSLPFQSAQPGQVRQSPHTEGHVEVSEPSPREQPADSMQNKESTQISDVIMLDANADAESLKKGLKDNTAQPAPAGGQTPSSEKAGNASALPTSTTPK